MYERILVPLDGSPFGEIALPRALALAERWGAAVQLATVANAEVPGDDPAPTNEVGDDFREVARTHARDYLSDVEARIRAVGFDGELAHMAIPAGNVAHSLVRHLEARACDIVVMTTHGRGRIRRAWLGSAADAFIRRSPVPVLLIRPPESGEQSRDEGAPLERPDLALRPAPFRRVLLPLDGSSEAEGMLETTAPLVADEPEAECILLRVVPPYMPGGSPYLPHVVREVESQAMVEKAAWEYLDSVRDRAPCAVVRDEVVTEGRTAVAILRMAEEAAVDLIAMSTAGRGGVTRLLLGSVADKVVRGAEVPLLVHREPEES